MISEELLQTAIQKGFVPNVNVGFASDALVQKWLREQKDIDIIPVPRMEDGKKFYRVALRDWKNEPNLTKYFGGIEKLESYEIALELGIKKALELL